MHKEIASPMRPLRSVYLLFQCEVDQQGSQWRKNSKEQCQHDRQVEFSCIRFGKYKNTLQQLGIENFLLLFLAHGAIIYFFLLLLKASIQDFYVGQHNFQNVALHCLCAFVVVNSSRFQPNPNFGQSVLPR